MCTLEQLTSGVLAHLVNGFDVDVACMRSVSSELCAATNNSLEAAEVGATDLLQLSSLLHKLPGLRELTLTPSCG